MADDATIQERFDAFHAANPHVLTRMEQLTAQWLASGHSRVSTKMLFEVLRYEAGLATRGGDWKIDNRFSSRYARLIVARNPRWADAFETRALRAA